MRACATECGGVTGGFVGEDYVVCPACALLWAESPEKRDAEAMSHGTGQWSWESAARAFLDDFIRRRRAERQNGGKL